MRARFSSVVRNEVFSRRAHAYTCAPSARRVAFGGEGFELVEVGAEFQSLAEGGLQPVRERGGGALHERQDGGAPEDALRFGHVRVGVVAGNAEHVLLARLRHDGGTPSANAISRAAVWRAFRQ